MNYESVSLHAFRDSYEAQQRVGSWIDFYNDERPHEALGNCTPVVVDENDLKTKHAT